MRVLLLSVELFGTIIFVNGVDWASCMAEGS
jgi:hypothetical protein